MPLITSLLVVVADLRPGGALCARLQVCRATLDLRAYPNHPEGLLSSVYICVHEFFPTVAITETDPLIQSP